MDYLRVVGASGVFCSALIVAAIVLGVFGERDGLYLAFAGFIGLLMTGASCAVDYLMRKRKW